MTTMHEEWTDKLSEYLDGELSRDERAAVDAHLSECAACTAVLAELKRVVERAQALQPRPPQADLWRGISERIDERRPAATVAPFRRATGPAPERSSPARRISFTLPQLAAAAVLLMAVTVGLSWTFLGRPEGVRNDNDARAGGPVAPSAQRPGDSGNESTDVQVRRDGDAANGDVQLATVAAADPQYDAAVAELESALKKGRGRLDASTIAIVEHNLQIIDQAIEQARQALDADPANSYLSSHLFEARRRKLDLLRRAAVLSAESD
jgi:hypothetical protein